MPLQKAAKALHCVVNKTNNRGDKAHGAVALQLVWVSNIDAYIHAWAYACEHENVSVVT